ncbi:hypothetical protein PC9H_003637 [Pleurotus ostreatus]|uniref:Inner centromere protein ARK-binding domain-containing protein n=2 Tax=Pleurotus TaxID=5320 RepID=A0A8H7DU37_PLEOS|nr:uncharacterized protein PC9H_003637 [Pleurotus ostreatus]KAF7436804.1 hypothetical protein PC9H_003637 [Pleurotus ostreatus]KAG9222797.1 hypothetical protein CCMSSC00406_0000514 [Pleurotus cornucopiae]
MAQPGLLQWTNTVRLTMVEDYGRQFFKDQIQQQGFLFLEDYLDNILAASAKEDPLIDLVKTPGRKKMAKKVKLVPSKLNSMVLSSLDAPLDTETVLPSGITSEHADGDPFKHLAVPSFEKALHVAEEVTTCEDQVPPTNATSPPSSSAIEQNKHVPIATSNSVHELQTLNVVLPEQNELSVIVEGDEPADRSFAVATPARPDVSSHGVSLESVALDSKREGGISPSASLQPDMTTSSSVATFHSITLDSPQIPNEEQSGFQQLSANLSTPDSAPKPILEPEPHLKDVLRSAPLNTEQQTQENDIEIPLREENPPTITRKASVSAFPILPEPAPLRKSMRKATEPLMGPQATLGVATPGLPGGKRTSWLKKAREVKAMEETSKKFSTPTGSALASIYPQQSQPVLQGLKRKSEEEGIGGTADRDPESRKPKASKSTLGDFNLSVPEAVQSAEEAPTHDAGHYAPSTDVEKTSERDEVGIFNTFKKTMQGLGAQIGRNGKSLAGASLALAEARAAAEAKIAEREKQTNPAIYNDVEDKTTPMSIEQLAGNAVAKSHESERRSREGRLSVSELVVDKNTEWSKDAVFNAKVFHRGESSNPVTSSLGSVSTTPPHSPPASTSDFPPPVAVAAGPVFNKPVPVFVPPAPHDPIPQAKAASGLPSKVTQPTFSLPVPMSLGLGSFRPPPSNTHHNPLSAKSTLESLVSDRVFSSQDEPAWMPSTQDTEYLDSSQMSQSGRLDRLKQLDEDDDSWPVQDQVAGAVQWPFNVVSSKDDSMTWSSLPTQSQRGDTGPLLTGTHEIQDVERSPSHAIPGSFDMDFEQGGVDGDLDVAESEGNDIQTDIEEPSEHNNAPRSQSQLSITSSSSSQSQGGFFNQATKLVSSVLGTSKKGKTEVKSLQLAAAAAKKQQEESEKKAARLKEMDHRRQLALQRKAEEEKAKAAEQERKMKEDADRRKREREEHTEKRPLKGSTFTKKEEDTNKKRKITVEMDKKPEIKKPTKSTKPSPSTKPLMKPIVKQTPALASSAAYNTTSQPPTASSSKLPESKASKTALASAKGKAVNQIVEDDGTQPAQLLQSQMAARAKAQLDAARAQEPAIPSEAIDLPDINSEYSDSDDEDRPRTFNPPSWAQSPELRQALLHQGSINPDDIFGAIRPLRMEEIFRSRTSRFRARTSSANWTGTDRLTIEEERDYARRMGYR